MHRRMNRNQGGMTTKDLPKSISLKTIVRVWQEMAEKKGLLIIVLLFVMLSSALGIAGPYMIGHIIDGLIYESNQFQLLPSLLILLMIYFFYSLTTFLQNYWMVGIAQNTVFRLRTRLFSHLQQLPIAYFDKRQHGELMSRITNDMDNVSSTLNNSVIQIFSSILTLVGTLSVMLIMSPILTLITLIIVPLMYVGMKWITNRTGRLFKEQQRQLGQLNGFIEETVTGQKIIKTFSQEDYVQKEFEERAEKLREAGYWAQTYSGFIPKLMNMLNNLSFAIIALLGGYFAFNGWVTIGVMVAFTEYARQFTRPLNDLANQFNTILSAIAGAERVYDILDLPQEIEDEKHAQDLQKVVGKVEFHNVTFSYEKDGNTIQNASFIVQPGEMVALVGPTGAGKTTIINLLTRFYDANQGTIYIDDRPISSITRKSLRSHIGFVLQDVFLFEGTIKENIRYGRLNATDEEVYEASRKANAHSFIMRLPNGYDTVLSQDGSGISQGQKQLLSIARAILRNPSILILDEATSNIDTVTEIKIQEALHHLMKDRTTFVIAHRLNTILHADQIFVLKEGRIIERGTHASLIQQKGFYYQLTSGIHQELSS